MKQLKPEERELLRRFQALDILKGRWLYSFKIYTLPETPPPGELPWLWRDKRELKAGRIDAVVETETAIWLLEANPRISRRIAGALKTYESDYLLQEKPTKPVFLGYITTDPDRTLDPLLTRLGIKIWRV